VPQTSADSELMARIMSLNCSTAPPHWTRRKAMLRRPERQQVALHDRPAVAATLASGLSRRMGTTHREAFFMDFRAGSDAAPTIVNSTVERTREYLTASEVEALMAAARKSSRYGHRDATMILIAYRHRLRASEVCDLQWHQVELAAGRLHVRRSKRGTASVHPLQGDELRALRRLQREQSQGRTRSCPSAAHRWRRRASSREIASPRLAVSLDKAKAPIAKCYERFCGRFGCR
jgi:integrase